MARLLRVPRPDEGDERDVIWSVRHRCAVGEAMFREFGEVADEINFPVGVQGWGMPSGIPFEVWAGHECPACGVHLRAWAQWESPTLFFLN